MFEWNIFTHSWSFSRISLFNIYHSYFTHDSRLNGSTSRFGFLASILHNLYNAFNIFGTIVGLVANLAECKRSVITKCLQCPRTDAQLSAYIVVIHHSSIFFSPCRRQRLSTRCTKYSNLAAIPSKVLSSKLMMFIVVNIFSYTYFSCSVVISTANKSTKNHTAMGVSIRVID